MQQSSNNSGLQQSQQHAFAAPAFNEAFSGDGVIRSQWQYVLESLKELGPDNCNERQLVIERILRDDGATYNDYSHEFEGRPWPLDPIPFLLESEEWSSIEAGVRERAELLNLILKDLYSDRTLIRYGVLPAELIFSHPGFLRRCQGISLPGDQQLIQYAVDMVRAPDGAMRVIADRTQAPSGAGYALENRSVISRVFPSLFRDSHVHRLALYFHSLRAKLNSLNPNGGVAHVAVLTPGTYNETYFEHVFLANYLGYPLVQGSDLTVRDGYVWMKTLEGLNRIDVILRRVDDYFCDPVELFSESQLGVPGLLEVIRSGNVVVTNPLGSGILEHHGLLKYLPAAARHFLGRELSLSAVPTRWCGDAEDLKFTIANIEQLLVKTTFRGPNSKVIFGGSLSSAEREDLVRMIRARPLHYVSQEMLTPSSVPVWQRGSQELGSAVLRSFAVAAESSYSVMPGGLTRVSLDSKIIEITNRLGSLSKDTWVLASEPEKQVSLIGAGESLTAAQAVEAVDLPSRVVENLFWLGRYAERAEYAIRLLRTIFIKLEGSEVMAQSTQQLLLRAVTQLTCTYPGFLDESFDETRIRAELLSVILDNKREGSVVWSLSAFLAAADQVKELLSADTQRIFNDLRDEIEVLPDQLQHTFDSAPEEQLDSLVTTLLAFAGLTQESMTQGLGWRFLEMGRRIERILQMISLVRSLWVPANSVKDEYLMIESLLQSVESLISFRRRYHRQMEIGNGLDFILIEPTNPRSIIFQIDRLQQHLEATEGSSATGRATQVQRLVLEAGTSLRLAEPESLSQVEPDKFLRSDLDQLLARVQYLIATAANSLSNRYFDHSAGPQSLVKDHWEERP